MRLVLAAIGGAAIASWAHNGAPLPCLGDRQWVLVGSEWECQDKPEWAPPIFLVAPGCGYDQVYASKAEPCYDDDNAVVWLQPSDWSPEGFDPFSCTCHADHLITMGGAFRLPLWDDETKLAWAEEPTR